MGTVAATGTCEVRAMGADPRSRHAPNARRSVSDIYTSMSVIAQAPNSSTHVCSPSTLTRADEKIHGPAIAPLSELDAAQLRAAYVETSRLKAETRHVGRRNR